MPHDLVAPAHRHAFCGIAVDALPPARLIDTFARAIDAGGQHVIGHHNLHGLALLDDDGFRRFFDRTAANFVDGMSLVALARLAGVPLQRDDRATVLDWIWLLFDRAERDGWRIVHVGSHQEVIATATDAVRARRPDLDLHCIDGFFDATPRHPESLAVTDRIGALAPQVLLVGMGMPRQERWVADHLDDLPDTVIVTVGGILGYLGEDRSTPPRWAGRLGLEWLARLASEPGRLGHRYLVEPLPLVPRLTRAVLAERRARRAR